MILSLIIWNPFERMRIKKWAKKNGPTVLIHFNDLRTQILYGKYILKEIKRMKES